MGNDHAVPCCQFVFDMEVKKLMNLLRHTIIIEYKHFKSGSVEARTTFYGKWFVDEIYDKHHLWVVSWYNLESDELDNQ